MTVPVHGLPPLLHDGLTVAVVPPPLKESRWHQVTAVVSQADAGSLVALSGVDDRAAAEGLAGRVLLARVDDLPCDYELHDADALLGREVTDERHGALGRIEEVLRGVANDVWVIRGPYGELLVPVVDEVIDAVPDEGPLPVRLPRGIVDEGRGGHDAL